MDPSELRINNLVTVTNGTQIPLSTVFKIVTIKLFQVDLVRHDQIPAQVESFFQKNYYELTPIPLTEDWLKRFGCKKLGTIWWETPKGLQFNFGDTCGLIMFGSRHVNFWHVHTFQNIVVLTGEELKLN